MSRTSASGASGGAATPAAVADVADGQAVQHWRMVEAMLFAADGPVSESVLAERLPDGADVSVLLAELERHYSARGVMLVKVADGWMFRTAPDLSFLLRREPVSRRRLSRAALETLAIIAYHQPVSRAEIEEIRGVTVSGGTVDVLMETGWVRIRGRRKVPGRPIVYGTTVEFLAHFDLETLAHLPERDELKAAGFLDSRLPAGFEVPTPSDGLDGEDDDIEPLSGDDESFEGVPDELLLPEAPDDSAD